MSNCGPCDREFVVKRAGTSVADDARKLNNWLERQIGHRKSCLVLSARYPVVN